MPRSRQYEIISGAECYFHKQRKWTRVSAPEPEAMARRLISCRGGRCPSRFFPLLGRPRPCPRHRYRSSGNAPRPSSPLSGYATWNMDVNVSVAAARKLLHTVAQVNGDVRAYRRVPHIVHSEDHNGHRNQTRGRRLRGLGLDGRALCFYPPPAPRL